MFKVRNLLVFTCILCLAGATLAQKVRPSPKLKEADVLKLIELQPSDSAILSRLRASKLGFTVDNAALARFKSAGASQDVLDELSRLGNATKKDAPAVNPVTSEKYEPEKEGNGAIEIRGIEGFKFYDNVLHPVHIADANGNYVGFAGYTRVNSTYEVSPGDYSVLTGYKLPVEVKSGQKTIVQLGGIIVSGMGTSHYQIFMPDGKTRVRLHAKTQTGQILLAGKYKIRLGEEFRDVKIEAGKVTQVKTGSLQANGGFWTFTTRDGKRRLHVNSADGVTIEFFPGEYLVTFGITNKKSIPVVIEVGKKTVVSRNGRK